MYIRPEDVRDAAGSVMAKTKDYIYSTTSDAQDNARRYTKKMYKNYAPAAIQARDKAYDISAKALDQTRGTLDSVGTQALSLSRGLGRNMRYAEMKALKAGFLYAVYKLFIADDKMVYETTNKIKARIQERPVESAFIALGAGYLLGKLFR